MTTKTKVKIRWLIRRDMPEVLEIERSCFEYAWTEDDFLCCLRHRNEDGESDTIGLVAEHDHTIVGFMIYEFHKMKLRIINFAVAPVEQRRGIGTAMIDRLKGKLAQRQWYREEIILEIRDSNLDAQLFFRSLGFQAIGVLHDHYDDTGEDAYQMSFLRMEP